MSLFSSPSGKEFFNSNFYLYFAEKHKFSIQSSFTHNTLISLCMARCYWSPFLWMLAECGGIPMWQSDMKIAGIHERQIWPSCFRFYPLWSHCCISVALVLTELPSRHRVTHFFLALSCGSMHTPEQATTEQHSADIVWPICHVKTECYVVQLAKLLNI